jgi:hypothetical protein
MIRSPHGGGNIESTMTAAMDADSRYLLTGDTGPADPQKQEPPTVLISPDIVAQMRRRKQQLEALQEWAQSRQEVSR